METAQALTIDPSLNHMASARQIYANMVSQRLLEDLQGSRTTSPSAYSHNSRDTARPLATASHSSLSLAQPAPEQAPAPVDAGREQDDDVSSDEEEGQYENHSSRPPYRASGVPFVPGEVSGGRDGPNPTMMPLRADTLTPITEKSDVASRKTSINTMNTLDRARGPGGSQSSNKQPHPQGSGSGSSHLGRNPSAGTRLVEPMVVEEVMTLSPVASSRPQLSTEDVTSDASSVPLPVSAPAHNIAHQTYNGGEREMAADAPDSPFAHDTPNTIRETTEVVAPKPQKPSDAFDEDLVLQDNAYLMDQIALTASPEKSRAHLSPAPALSEKSPELANISPGALDRSSRSNLGRKPSGARAMPPKRQTSGASQVPSLQSVSDEHRPSTPPAPLAEPLPIPRAEQHHGMAPSPSLNADAMAALTFLDGAGSPRQTREAEAAQPRRRISPVQVVDDNKAAQRSSFAPSKAAQDRRARAQEAEKHRDNVMTKPGVRRAPMGRKKTDWSASSDDEDEEDENSESDSDGDGKPSTAPPTRPSSGVGSRPNLPQAISQMSLGRTTNGRPMPHEEIRRAPRNLPPIPGTQRASSAAYMDNRTRPSALEEGSRSASWAYQDPPPIGGASGQHSPLSGSVYNSGDEARLPATAYRPPARTNMWNSDLDAPHLGIDANDQSQKFVQLDTGNTQMTKAFTPHGLLQAGLQDKEDRSAKRQEENAKESGSSLVNVPNKPPPPQAGLLGAITAHERDRKAPGGIGAALTERERDRRLAVSGLSVKRFVESDFLPCRRNVSDRLTIFSRCSDRQCLVNPCLPASSIQGRCLRTAGPMRAWDTPCR